MSKSSQRPRRLLRWSLLALLVVVVIGAGVGGSVWFYLFGREGTPVAEYELDSARAVVDPQWEDCQLWFARLTRTLKRTRDLRGTMLKQERIGDRLEPMATIQFKIRKRPISIYLCWIEPTAGREVIFEYKKRKNRVLAHEGVPLRAVSPDVLMTLRHPLAMKFSRHPVNELSLQYLIQQLRVYLADAEANPDLDIALDKHQELRDTTCVHIRFRHPMGSAGPEGYCRFDVYVERETRMPLRWELYSFAEDGSEQLIEYFEIIDYERNVDLEDADFDPQNDAYHFNPKWVMEL